MLKLNGSYPEHMEESEISDDRSCDCKRWQSIGTVVDDLPRCPLACGRVFTEQPTRACARAAPIQLRTESQQSKLEEQGIKSDFEISN